MTQEDYYRTLGVGKEASQKTIKEVYRKLALQYHPDKNRGAPEALAKMKEINEAYAVLSDPEKRRRYDALKEEYGSYAYDRFKQRYSEQDIFKGSDINQVFEEMARAFGIRGFGEVFEECYGPGCRTFEFKRPGFFGKGFIFVGPMHRRERGGVDQTGGSVPPQITPGVFGKITGHLLKKMLGLREGEKGKDLFDVISIDPLRTQEGGKFRYIHRKKSKELVVTVPMGLREGQKIRLKGMGEEGKHGGEPGDLYLKVRFKKSLIQRGREVFKSLQSALWK
jgi:DnaJ-class molecular chaperone